MDPKPGWQTTEFWLGVVALILVNVGATFTGNQWAQLGGAIGTAIVAAGYTLSRGNVKKAGGILAMIGMPFILGGCWLFEATDYTPLIEANRALTQKYLDRDEFDRWMVEQATWPSPAVKSEVLRAYDTDRLEFLQIAEETHKTLTEAGGSVDWRTVAETAFDLYIQARTSAGGGPPQPGGGN